MQGSYWSFKLSKSFRLKKFLTHIPHKPQLALKVLIFKIIFLQAGSFPRCFEFIVMNFEFGR